MSVGLEYEDAEALTDEANALERALGGDGDLIDGAWAAVDLMRSVAKTIKEVLDA